MKTTCLQLFLCFATLLATDQTPAVADDLGWLTAKPVPQWIWSPGEATAGQKLYLRTSFDLPAGAASADLYTTCDNRMTLWINGKEIGSSPDWSQPIRSDVAKQLKVGRNTIAVAAQNEGGIAAFVLKLVVAADGKKPKQSIISDGSWRISTDQPADGWQSAAFDDSDWATNTRTIGALGRAPWSIPGRGNRSSSPGTVTPANELDVASGFAVDLIYTVPKDKFGSWVSLCNGPDGSLIACDQGGQGLASIQVIETADGPKAEVQPLNIPNPDGKGSLSGAQGLLHAFGALWFHKNGGNLFRITDSDNDGAWDKSEEVPSGRGGGEHGNHALLLSQDGKSIYMDGGNHAPLHDVTRSRVQSYQEDHLLPRMWDARGHARGKLAPGGWVTELNPKTLEQELVCIGFRNQYDIAMNQLGDIFTYDADMEYDFGSPWYRPTRICQVVSGADYGWRSGTGKWPTYYEDSLPPIVDIGPGSPTGVASGSGSKFPAKYQRAIFALDWTFGTIYAIHLTPSGASYTGESEAFVTGVPLPVTDAIVGKDGYLYFTVGGRGTQSGLYRVRYTGQESTEPVGPPALSEEIQLARQARVQLETFHGRADSEAVDIAWPHLQTNDRFLRSAARVAVESQPVESWADRACTESHPQAAITAAVALARMGDEKHRDRLLENLLRLNPSDLSESQTLGLLRAYALTFVRLGRPAPAVANLVIERLNPMLPNPSQDVNTELVRVLTYLRSPTIVAKAMELITNRPSPELPDWSELASRNPQYGRAVQSLLDNPPPIREFGYAFMLRSLREGWTLADRRAFFEFLNTAAKASGGASYTGFLTAIRDEALGNMSDADRAAVSDLSGEDFNPVPDFEIVKIEGPGQKWTIDEALRKAATGFNKASFERGRSLFFAASCGKCHRCSGLGGDIGPDLTSIPNKFDVRYLVEHIIEPSKVISDQYQSSVVLTVDGRSYTGIVAEEASKIIVYPADAKAEPVVIDADDVDDLRPSPVSQMPTATIDGLNPAELRDLLAYLMSQGDAKNKIYGKR